MPVRVIDESEAVKKNAGLLASFGTKALIVTGKNSARKNGSYDDICEALDSMNVPHVLFDGVEENPDVETVMHARDLGLAEGADFVIGAGGGSPMDAAKAVALMIRHKDEGADYLYRAGAPSDTVPVIEVPTTCGTGSEVTPVSVITVPEKHTKISIKHKVFPQLALIDGKYLRTASGFVLNSTAIDALTHLIESFLNRKMTDYTRMCVDGGLRLWKKSLPVVRGLKAADDTDLANMMRASMMAGMSIAQGGTTLPHGLSYPLTFYERIPHGKAVGYFTAGYLACAAEKDREYLLGAAGFESLEDFQQVLASACGSVEVSDDLLNAAVDEISGNQAKLSAVPFECTREILEKIAFYSRKTGYSADNGSSE